MQKGLVYLRPTNKQPTFSTDTIALVYKREQRQRFLPQSCLHGTFWERKICQGAWHDYPLPFEVGLFCSSGGSRVLPTEVPGDSNAASSSYIDATEQANAFHHSVGFLQSSA